MPVPAQAGQSQGETSAAAGFMYQVPDFHDRNCSSLAEVTGRAEGAGWLGRKALEHAHFLSHAGLSLFSSLLTASYSHFVTFWWMLGALHFQFLHTLHLSVQPCSAKRPYLSWQSSQTDLYVGCKICSELQEKGLRGPFVFPYPIFMQHQSHLYHSCLLWV